MPMRSSSGNIRDTPGTAVLHGNRRRIIAPDDCSLDETREPRSPVITARSGRYA